MTPGSPVSRRTPGPSPRWYLVAAGLSLAGMIGGMWLISQGSGRLGRPEDVAASLPVPGQEVLTLDRSRRLTVFYGQEGSGSGLPDGLEIIVVPHDSGETGTARPTGTGPSTVPASTVPASTVPASTVPASSVPASSVPASTVPVRPLAVDWPPYRAGGRTQVAVGQIQLQGGRPYEITVRVTSDAVEALGSDAVTLGSVELTGGALLNLAGLAALAVGMGGGLLLTLLIALLRRVR